MSLVVTGATGSLGRLVVESLLARGVPAAQIVAAGRNIAKIADLAERGVTVRSIEYADPESVRAALAGAEKLLLVSGSEIGQRLPQHRTVIDVAAELGVSLVVYTSIVKADSTPMLLAAEHLATEEMLRDSGVPHALLRNGWYLENYTAQLAAFLEHGAVIGSAGQGRVSAATRADFAEAAAAVLLADGQAGQAYELGGDESFTLDELAAEVSGATGTEVVYQDLPLETYVEALVAAGLPPAAATVIADSDLGVARGDLFVATGDLSRLIGRPTTSMSDAVRAATGALAAATP
jgi:NAD(P)H dehydrogenase (quinone)